MAATRSSIAAGFDLYDAPAAAAAAGAHRPGTPSAAERPGSEAVAAAIRFLDSTAARPFFLLLHLYEPHAPYRPPEPFRSRYADPYDGEIAAADDLVGRFLAELDRRGLYDRALVVLLSDHGEGLGDHGEDEHGLLLYREAIQVPLVVKLPGAARAGERVRRNVGLIDVVPTVLDLLQAPAGMELPGVSLLAHGNSAPAVDRPIYSETMYPLIHFGWSDLASIVSGDLHLVEGLRPELYDLARDPQELSDRTLEERRPLAAMRRGAEHRDRLGIVPFVVEPQPSQHRRDLAHLVARIDRGRPAAVGRRRSEVAQRAERRDRLGIGGSRRGQGAVDGGHGAAHRGERSALAWQYLGASYDALGRKNEAVLAYRHGMSLAGSPAYLAETAALRLLELGRARAAVDLLAGELERHPTGSEGARLRVLYSRALMQVGRIADAARFANEAVALDPKLADAFYQRAVVALARQDGLAAIEDLVTAATLDARHIEARKALAMLRHAQGDDTEARRLLAEVLAIDPDDRDARADLATLESAGGGAAAPR